MSIFTIGNTNDRTKRASEHNYVTNLLSTQSFTKLIGKTIPSKNAQLLIYYSGMLTPGMANDLLQNVNGETRQRNIDKKRIKNTTDKINNGEYFSREISIAIYPDGTHSILDGQHALTALIDANYNSKLHIMFKLFYVKNSDQAGRLFYSFDNQLSSRKSKDNNLAYGVSNKTGVADSLIDTYTTAAILEKQNFVTSINQYESKNIENKVAYLNNYKQFIDIMEPVHKKIKKDNTLKEIKTLFTNAKSICILMALYNDNPREFERFIKLLLSAENIASSEGKTNKIFVSTWKFYSNKTKKSIVWTSVGVNGFKVILQTMWNNMYKSTPLTAEMREDTFYAKGRQPVIFDNTDVII